MPRNKVSIALLALLGGCAAMEQAPLVYSSAKQFGLGVKSGAPDAPGLDVTIGFRALDAAYVPVAVAKQCPAGQQCSGVSYNVLPINGKSEISGLRQVDDQRIAAETRAIEEGVRAIDERARRKAALAASVAEIKLLATDQARLAALTAAAATAPLSATEDAERVQLQARVDRVTKLDAQALGAEITRLEGENATTARQVEEARGRLRTLLAQRSEQTGDAKTDALSVYGTFNGDSSGNVDGASLRLGNTFSTGVAAQNMTQGLRESAPTRAVHECLAAIKVILDSSKVQDTAKPELVKGVIAACGLPRPAS
ncbi:hypothetical protein GVO57_12375 [Sphingomonas changnyeongensis]|uniref:Lipoprotein n=1 Tax=Sphingomonas changnyeongensis TaxID=2698679 RepID=A0A7Z2NX55_9SPHN|nr:hypothetical protein [Sphingomonas changnyeongensis]QHL91458.1 hypothetical protein GVO57_12375 [Sphingomonas changnyeongensis]